MAYPYDRLAVLAPGRRVTKRREAGEVYGLRLKAGGAVPAVVIQTGWPSGFMAGATAIWVFGLPQYGDALDVDAFDNSDPITPPMLVDRSLWSHGVAFRWGRVSDSHPFRQHRFLYQDTGGFRPIYDRTNTRISAARRGDVVGVYGHTLLLGVDTEVDRGLRELRAAAEDG